MGAARYSRSKGYVIARSTQRPMVRTTQRRVKLGPTTAKYLGLAVLGVLAIIMLSQSSTNATSAYEQNKIRKESSQVSQDIERLRLEAKRAQSIQSIQDTQVKEQMQPMGDDVEFVETGEVAGASTTEP